MDYTFEVNDKKEIRIWGEDKEGAPLFFQPSWPNGQEWESVEQATEWAELFLDSLTNPESEFIPGPSPEEPKRERLEPAGPPTAIF
jgi:hypothetical protein